MEYVVSSAAPSGNPPIRWWWLTLNEGMHTLHLVYSTVRIYLDGLDGYDEAKGINSSAGACDYALVRTRAQTLIVRQNDSISAAAAASRRWLVEAGP